MRVKKIIKRILILVLFLLVILLAGILIYVNLSINSVKEIDVSLDNVTNYSEIYSENMFPSEYTKKLNNKNISINSVPEITKQAFISIEDKDFYKHNGLNIKRIAKASINNLLSRELKEGASTITQQLVKNKFLTNEKTFNRKIKEAYLSLKVEKKETKDKILETYLNTIYFGHGAYGISSASKVYFNKNIEELNLVESATLAGIIKSPSNYSPINNYEKSNQRKNLVLKEMYKDNLITNEQYNEAINENIDITNYSNEYIQSELDLYSQYVLDEASKILNTNIYNVIHGGYKIYTYQDDEIQKNLNSKIFNDKYYMKNQYSNIADSLSIIVDNKSGGVSAIAGNSKYNLVNVSRQPGSLIKPILTYLPAIEEGLINEKTQILDEKINYNGYSPNNVGNKYYGYISVEDAVAKSLNIPTIKITEKVGLDKCKNYASKCGIKFNQENDNGYSIALGGFTDGVTLKEITDSYSVLINNGKYRKSSFIKKIKNMQNVTICDNKMSESMVYGDDTIYQMTKILNYSVKNGTSKKLSGLDFDVAGKTGTVAVPNSNYNTDAYSLAYTNDHTMSVWLGNYSMKNEYNLVGSNNGGTYATEIIRDTFAELYNISKPENFIIPNSVEECIIDLKSLNEDHIVVSGDNVPERYKTTCFISKRFLPLKISTKFNNLNPFNLEVFSYKNSCELMFNTHDYIDYKIYREHDSKIELLKTIKNNNGIYSYIDNSISNNKLYSYYITAQSNYSSDSYTTEKKQVYLHKEFDEIISNEKLDNFSWIFN